MSLYPYSDRDELRRAAYPAMRCRGARAERTAVLELIAAARQSCVPHDSTDGVLAELERAVRSRGESP